MTHHLMRRGYPPVSPGGYPAWDLTINSAGLKLAYRADNAIIDGSGQLTTWVDLSGAEIHAVQTVPGNRAPWTDAHWASGLPIATFDGLGDHYVIGSSDTIQGSAVEFYMFVAGNYGTHPASGRSQIIDWATDRTILSMNYSTSGLALYEGNHNALGVDPESEGNFVLLTGVTTSTEFGGTGTDIWYAFNGAVSGLSSSSEPLSLAASTRAINGAKALGCGSAFFSDFYKGGLTEFRLWSGTLTKAVITALSAYSSATYGLALE